MPKTEAKKILIAEDDPGTRRIVTIALEKAGLKVIQAKDGAEAFDMARQLRPDAILLDIGLPKMDGLEVCKKLHSTPGTAGIPVGFLTAHVESESYQEAAKTGGVLFMPKPFKPEKLANFVNILLASVRTEPKEIDG